MSQETEAKLVSQNDKFFILWKKRNKINTLKKKNHQYSQECCIQKAIQ